jgi:hypothetical protein
MGPRSSEDQVARALTAAVERWVAEGTASTPLPWPIEEGIDNLLYQHGSDGLRELSVSQSRSFSITILGLVIWVAEQTLGPLEAEFQLDKAGAVVAFTLRAGDGRISKRDAPEYGASWRTQLRTIETRPTADEDWARAHVLHYEFG